MEEHDHINACLPDELIVKIFRHLDSESEESSRDACSLVCKRWRALERLSRTFLRFGSSGSTDLYINVFARCFVNVENICINEPWEKGDGCDPLSYCLSDAGLTVLAEGFPKLEKLSLYFCANISNLGLMSLAYKCATLKSLDLQDCYFGDQGLDVVGKSCMKLEDLNLCCCEGLTDTCLVGLVLGCGKSLKSLGIEDCDKITDVSLEAVGSHCKSLETLSLGSNIIDNKGVLAVAQGCHLMKVLKLQCTNIKDEVLIAVGAHCLSLELLELNRSELLTDTGLCAIGRGCKKLKSLRLFQIPFLTEKALEAIARGCKELTHLLLDSCLNIGTMGLESIGRSCLQLTKLHVRYCPLIGDSALAEVGRGCKLLQGLRLFYCLGIGDDGICSIAKGCRRLRKLQIFRCPKIGSKGVLALVDYSMGSLEKLCLGNCQIGDAEVTAIARGRPELNHLALQELPDMSDVALAELGEACPLVKNISFSCCSKITDVGLADLVKNCTMLERISIDHCEGITASGVAAVVTCCANIRRVGLDNPEVSEKAKQMTGCFKSASEIEWTIFTGLC